MTTDRFMGEARRLRLARRVVLVFGTVTLLITTARVAAAQETAREDPSGTPATNAQVPVATPTAADESEWIRWTSGRYRLTPGDVFELKFPFVPELDQTLSVQPDGYVTLREVGDVRVQGRTLPQVRADLLEAYESIVREPVFTITLKEFEKPYFVASGEVSKPGRYDLRGATTLTQALALAGGSTKHGRLSQVVVFRYHTENAVSARQVNVNQMYSKHDLSEDPLLQPGDIIFVPKTTLGKIDPALQLFGVVAMWVNPFAFLY